jgi:ribosomal protein S18 acetylase RimI-like enzyme
MSLSILDHIVWHSLAGPHAGFSAGTNTARRYVAGFSPIIGFADSTSPDFAALEGFCEPGTLFYCAEWSGAPAPGWQIEDDSAGHQMLWQTAAPPPDAGFAAIPLEGQRVPQMLALAAAAGLPLFGPRSIELGEYIGVFQDGELVAMAGERMTAGRFREISAVCTHPEFRGRGYAARLIAELVRRQMQRGETPFLHVMHDNSVAVAVYRRMGFRHHQDVALRVVRRTLPA